ncbi:hypothetical protein D8Y20_07320 [Mariprofundus sp. EBB-1]|uniref:restriction endonuclease n=1 Tax=Mariprofundus sp. EBB-1 TaxID=2650971 RepID=UPI000EF26F8A|nr:restriction endonuclease [Mariprofundus sp. EBB-1]RLL52209.1 hypothetical protein D8Y20_07320 [Mariprofundus sp. EBB-1]
MARRRKESTIEALFTLPWWVSGVLATGVFYSSDIIRLISPVSNSQYGAAVQNSFIIMSDTLSPFVATALLIISLIVLVKDTYKKRKNIPATRASKRRGSVKAPWDNKVSVPSTYSCPTKSKVKEPVWGSRVESESKPAGWSLELLQSIEWKRFEELCEAVFNEINLLARNTQLGADGGIDIELYDKKSPKNLLAIAQCKAWSNPVGVKHIREFYGVMAASRISKGYFVTTSSFTVDAIEFSKKSKVTLIDGGTVLKLIESRSPDKASALLKLATAGDYTTPTCPVCGQKLIARKVSRSGRQFWGCRSYPRCKGKLNMKQGNCM